MNGSDNIKAEELFEKLYDCYYMINTEYNKTALLFNACNVTRNYINETFQENNGINTKGQVEENPFDSFPGIKGTFNKQELVNFYSEELCDYLVKHFLISIIQIIDDAFSEIYEELLSEYTKLNKKEIKKIVSKNIWYPDKNAFCSFLQNKLNFEEVKEKISTLEMTIHRYRELRLMRNCIVHSNSVIDENDKRSAFFIEAKKEFDEFVSQNREKLEKDYDIENLTTMMTDSIKKGNKLYFPYDFFLGVWQWISDFLSYFFLVFEQNKQKLKK